MLYEFAMLKFVSIKLISLYKFFDKNFKLNGENNKHD